MPIQRLLLLLLTNILLITTIRGNRIIGGNDAENGFAPYQISLQTLPGYHLCGGAIIDRRWIITAGHCVTGWPVEYLRIAIGTNRYREPDAIHYPHAIHIHCNYNEPRYANDLALIQLNDTILYNNRTLAIGISLFELEENANVLFTGWGANAAAGAPVDNLQKLSTKLISRAVCRQMMSDFEDVDVDIGHICTFAREGKGACHGDTGSPLIGNNKLIGILNFNIPCATGVPDIFINVLYYRDWIRTIMSGNTRC